MPRLCSLVLAVGILATVPTAAGAEETPEWPMHLALVAGRYYIDADTHLGEPRIPGQAPRDAGVLGLRVAYDLVTLASRSWIAPRLSLEGEGLFAFSTAESEVEDSSTDIWAPILSYRGSFVLSLLSNFPLQPFVLFGAGGQSLVADGGPLRHGDTDLALHAGGGVRIRAGRISMRLDYRQVLGDARDSSSYSRSHELLLGMGVHFGFCQCDPRPVAAPPTGPLDYDDDGLVDDDQCPRNPEDLDGFEDDDGCPDIDNDGDRIADALDACPDKAELVNAIDDLDGCPEDDPDGDGLVGDQDTCPADPEDKDGFQDADGCPDTDNDSDGIADATDACPDKPETVNQYDDADGCPDEIPQTVARFTGTIEGITFETGTARLQIRSYVVLNEAITVLKEYPSVKLEIQGHTDSVGGDDANLQLSQERADAVLGYLTRNGIDPARLSAVGYGEAQPVASNRTRAGRARNRRVDFVRK